MVEEALVAAALRAIPFRSGRGPVSYAFQKAFVPPPSAAAVVSAYRYCNSGISSPERRVTRLCQDNWTGGCRRYPLMLLDQGLVPLPLCRVCT